MLKQLLELLFSVGPGALLWGQCRPETFQYLTVHFKGESISCLLLECCSGCVEDEMSEL